MSDWVLVVGTVVLGVDVADDAGKGGTMNELWWAWFAAGFAWGAMVLNLVWMFSLSWMRRKRRDAEE